MILSPNVVHTVAGEGFAGEGESPYGPADVTLTMAIEDVNSLLQGDMGGFAAYMTGRLQIQGDIQAAMALQEVIGKIGDKVFVEKECAPSVGLGEVKIL